MKVVILAGGRGSRIEEESVSRPKPMVEIAGRPVLWHIMKHYAHHGFNEFVVALGYKGEIIKDYFLNFAALRGDLAGRPRDRQDGEDVGDARKLAHSPRRHGRADRTPAVAFAGSSRCSGSRALSLHLRRRRLERRPESAGCVPPQAPARGDHHRRSAPGTLR